MFQLADSWFFLLSRLHYYWCRSIYHYTVLTKWTILHKTTYNNYFYKEGSLILFRKALSPKKLISASLGLDSSCRIPGLPPWSVLPSGSLPVPVQVTLKVPRPGTSTDPSVARSSVRAATTALSH